MIVQAPIRFDRATGVLEGTNAWERLAAMTLVAGTRMSAPFSYRGDNACANFQRKALPARDIAVKLNAVKLNDDAIFAFPYGDGYWSKLLYRGFRYEDELEILFEDCRDIDYVLVDGGANYGYWSVLLCEDHGFDRSHSVSRYILEQTPMQLIVLDRAVRRFEPVTDLAVLDRVKVATNVGYNVFATASAFWQDRFANLNERVSRRVH